MDPTTDEEGRRLAWVGLPFEHLSDHTTRRVHDETPNRRVPELIQTTIPKATMLGLRINRFSLVLLPRLTRVQAVA